MLVKKKQGWLTGFDFLMFRGKYDEIRVPLQIATDLLKRSSIVTNGGPNYYSKATGCYTMDMNNEWIEQQ